ncbi:MAG TPA: dethiobiotin synthase [Steroidobacteraceae bacterium]
MARNHTSRRRARSGAARHGTLSGPQRALYVTGTDTGVGKTLVAVALVRALNAAGLRTRGLKPLASGAMRTPQGLRNADALALQTEGRPPAPYELVNPFCFEPAIAPHLAAAEAGVPTPLATLLDWYAQATRDCDRVVIEGAGGWRVPLHPEGYTSNLPEALRLPVLLVVGVRLGCLNHARLTFEAIRAARRAPFAGWIANRIDPTAERAQDNIATLERLLECPPLAVIPWLSPPDTDVAARALAKALDRLR